MAPTTLSDLSYDELDAVLRDPNAPGDVRARAAMLVSEHTYLRTVDFHRDSEDTPVNTRPRDPNTEPVENFAPDVTTTANPARDPNTEPVEDFAPDVTTTANPAGEQVPATPAANPAPTTEEPPPAPTPAANPAPTTEEPPPAPTQGGNAPPTPPVA